MTAVKLTNREERVIHADWCEGQGRRGSPVLMGPRGVCDNGESIVEPVQTAGDCQLESTGGLTSGRDASTVAGHGGGAEDGRGGRLLLASS